MAEVQQACKKCKMILTSTENEWRAPDGSVGCDMGGSHEVENPSLRLSNYTGRDMMNTVLASYYAGMSGGITHAGLVIVAEDTGNVFLAQRAFDETDEPDVQETFEWPGGGLEPNETPWQGAQREFTEETGFGVPEGSVVNAYTSANGVYQGFIYVTPTQFSLDGWSTTKEVQAVAWVSPDGAQQMSNLRPEMANFDWSLVENAVSGNRETDQEYDMTEMAAVDNTEPDFDPSAFAMEPLMVHGVLAPENVESGDSRGFNVNTLTARPLPLPMTYQRATASQHDNAVATTSIDRLMRKDGLIHWEGRMVPSIPEADEVVGLLQHFKRYGVSIDGDQSGIDVKRSVEQDGTWFNRARISGACIVAIPAFHEAYIALGPHPDMPVAGTDEADTMVASGYLTASRGPGWVSDPKATSRIHDYWMPGHPGGDKIGWGTPGDFARAKALIGAKIAEHSPDKMPYLNQIIAQWHHDALGIWPSEHAEMERKAHGDVKASDAADQWSEVMTASAFKKYTKKQRSGLADKGHALPDGSYPIEDVDDLKNAIQAIGRAKDPEAAKALIKKRAKDLGETGLIPETWAIEGDYAAFNLVLTASVGERVRPPAEYFTQHPHTDALVIEDPDENGFRRTYGYAGEWGVCHIGKTGMCVEVPEDYKGFPEFHLGRMKVSGNDGETYLKTGLITYATAHRGAKQLLAEGPTQAHFDDLRNAWAAVTLGQDERGIWFSGVVLPTMDEDWLTTIEASGQVSGEWIRGALRTLLTVNVPGFPVMRSSAVIDDNGEVLALVACAHGTGECEPSPGEIVQALAKADAEVVFSRLKSGWAN